MVSINGGTPKWMVGENPMKQWMMTRGIPILGNLHMYIWSFQRPDNSSSFGCFAYCCAKRRKFTQTMRKNKRPQNSRKRLQKSCKTSAKKRKHPQKMQNASNVLKTETPKRILPLEDQGVYNQYIYTLYIYAQRLGFAQAFIRGIPFPNKW